MMYTTHAHQRAMMKIHTFTKSSSQIILHAMKIKTTFSNFKKDKFPKLFLSFITINFEPSQKNLENI